VLVRSYFDESWDSDVLCVAGYVFKAGKARKLDAEWRRMLSRYELPYFRMSACNQGTEPFDKLTKDECIAVQKKVIAIIGDFAAFGAAVTIDQSAFDKIITNKGFVRTAYELCILMVLTAVQVWMDEHNEQMRSSYFFEAGHAHQSLANALMDNMFRNQAMKDSYRYVAHVFVDKKESRPTQAADILAWQWYKDLMRRKNGAKNYRADCEALLSGTPHRAVHVGKETLELAIRWMNERSGGNWGNELAALALRDPSNPIFPKAKGEKGDAKALAEFISASGRASTGRQLYEGPPLPERAILPAMTARALAPAQTHNWRQWYLCSVGERGQSISSGSSRCAPSAARPAASPQPRSQIITLDTAAITTNSCSARCARSAAIAIKAFGRSTSEATATRSATTAIR
jgi:hypothetical protein